MPRLKIFNTESICAQRAILPRVWRDMSHERMIFLRHYRLQTRPRALHCQAKEQRSLKWFLLFETNCAQFRSQWKKRLHAAQYRHQQIVQPSDREVAIDLEIGATTRLRCSQTVQVAVNVLETNGHPILLSKSNQKNKKILDCDSESKQEVQILAVNLLKLLVSYKFMSALSSIIWPGKMQI